MRGGDSTLLGFLLIGDRILSSGCYLTTIARGRSESFSFSRCSSSASRHSSSSSHSRSFSRRSFDFRSLLLHGHLGFHGPHGISQQGIHVERAHGLAPRLRLRAFTLRCGEFAETAQVPRRSPHKRGKVSTVNIFLVKTKTNFFLRTRPEILLFRPPIRFGSATAEAKALSYLYDHIE